MTLVVGGVFGSSVIHVSDRLTSKKYVKKYSPDVYKPHDYHNNKTIIVVTDHCWLAIGFSGKAMFHRTWYTDQVIATSIVNYLLPTDIVYTPWVENDLKLPEIVRRIAAGVFQCYVHNSEPVIKPNDESLQILVSGLELFESHVRPLLFTLDFQAGLATPPVARHLVPVDWRMSRAQAQKQYRTSPGQVLVRTRFGVTGAVGWEHPTLKRALDAVRSDYVPDEAKRRGVPLEEVVRDLFMDAITEISDTEPTIGPDTMGVFMQPLRREGISVFRSMDVARQIELAQKSSIEANKRGPSDPNNPFDNQIISAPHTAVSPYILIGGFNAYTPALITRTHTRPGPAFLLDGNGGFAGIRPPPDLKIHVTGWNYHLLDPNTQMRIVPQARKGPPTS